MKQIAWCAVLSVALAISGCGSGTEGANTSSESPPQTTPPGGNVPSASGTFGGGQGKVLFAEGLNFPNSVSEFDLATRQVHTLAIVRPAISFAIDGGVTRANDGTFAVTGHDLSEPLAKTIVHHYQANGTFIRGWILDRAFFEGGALSPDAKSVALVQSTVFEDRLQIMILDLQSGKTVSGDLLGTNDSPHNKADLHASAVWSPAGELYVISEVGLHRVDRLTGAATLVHAVSLFHPRSPMMTPDARTIYFDQLSGNPRGGTIWSMELASGTLTRRSVRSKDGDQYSPTLSPDGEWMLLQEVNSAAGAIAPAPINAPNPLSGSLSVPFVVSAVRLSEPPPDTQNLLIKIVDVSGRAHSARGRMVWY